MQRTQCCPSCLLAPVLQACRSCPGLRRVTTRPESIEGPKPNAAILIRAPLSQVRRYARRHSTQDEAERPVALLARRLVREQLVDGGGVKPLRRARRAFRNLNFIPYLQERPQRRHIADLDQRIRRFTCDAGVAVCHRTT